MDFKDWITKKFIEWRGEKVTGASVASFADDIGISQQAMSEWMSGKKIPGRRALSKLAQHYPDVYQAVGMDPPPDKLTQFPPDFRVRLRRAIDETNAELERRGLTGEMPEAETITIAIFEKWGFKYTSTDTMDDAV